jgi:hypothetical protein
MNMLQDCRIVTANADGDVYRQEPEQRGSPALVMTQGQLIEFFRCPQRWIRGYRPPDTDAKAWGSMVDCMLLTPEKWDESFVVCPGTYRSKDGEDKPWRNDKRIKEVADWMAANESKAQIKADTLEAVTMAVARIKEEDEICDLLTNSERQVWVAGKFHHTATGVTVPVKALIDLAPSKDHWVFGNCLADFKTTRAGHPDQWKRWVFDRKYHVQAAFYLDLYNAATKENRDTWLHVIQESFQPFEPGRRILSERFIQSGRGLYLAMLDTYCRCLKEGIWPGYDSGNGALKNWTVTEPEPWMETDTLLEGSQGGLTDEELDEVFPVEATV